MAARRAAAPSGSAEAPAGRRAAQPAPGRPVRRPLARATDLDRLIHDRTRLAIISVLAVNDSLTFNDLKAATDTSDGNLSVHARKLEEAGYLASTKSFSGRVPKTEFRIAEAGRRALEQYLDHMHAIIRHARGKKG